MDPEDDLTRSFREHAAGQFQLMVRQAADMRASTPPFRALPQAWSPAKPPSDPYQDRGEVIEGSFRLLRPAWLHRKRLISGLVLVPGLVALAASCSSSTARGPEALPTLAPLSTLGPAPTPVAAQSAAGAGSGSYTVALGDVQAVVSATGQIVAAHQAQVSYERQAVVAKLDATVGQQVHAGDQLVELTDLPNSGPDLVANAQATVDRARLQLQVDDAKLSQPATGAAAADPAKAGVTVAQAQAKLDADQAALNHLQAGPDPSTVTAAKATLLQAQAQLQALQAGPKPEQRTVLQQQVQAARNALYAAQTSRDGSCSKANPDYVCSAAQASVAKAQTDVDTANTQYQLATAPASAADLQQAQAQVDAAQAKLNAAQAGPSADDIRQANSMVAADTLALQSAQADLARAKQGGAATIDQTLTQAQRQLDQLVLNQAQAELTRLQSAPGAGLLVTAPIDGVVTALSAHEGDVVQPGAVAAVVSDPTSVQVLANVLDTDVGQVAAGQAAQLTLASKPDQPLTGKVGNVSAVGQAQADKVVFPTTVTLDSNGTGQLALGMSVRLLITTGSARNVVVIPNQYIRRDSGQPFVQQLLDGKPTQVPIKLGLAGAGSTQVVSGLQPGDRVLPVAAVPAVPVAQGG